MVGLTIVVAALVSSTPKVGDIAPDFSVKDIDGKPVLLSQLVQQGPVLLAFFPKAFTPGCTQQLTGYTTDYDLLKEKSAHVVAVSTDDVATQRRFKESLGAPFTFVSDQTQKLIKLYDIAGGEAHGRAAFVIDKERRIMRVDLGDSAVKTDKAVTACNGSG
jgi:peroxiredoxin Q/BCP